MMGRVAERRQDNEQDGGANLPAPREESAPAARPPEPVDEEELRQFREFQEFQRFLEHKREHGDELVPAESKENGQRRRPPAWLTAFGGKLLTAALVLIAVAAGAAWAINHYLGGSSEPSTEELAEQGGKKATATKLYASDPYEAVRDVYDAIAQTNPDTGKPEVGMVCLRFDVTTRARFASDLGYGSCRQAAIALNEQVTHVTNYAESMPSWSAKPPRAETVRIDSCTDSVDGTITGGPALGTFIVTKIPDAMGEQWLITGHEPGPRHCPAPKRTGTK